MVGEREREREREREGMATKSEIEQWQEQLRSIGAWGQECQGLARALQRSGQRVISPFPPPWITPFERYRYEMIDTLKALHQDIRRVNRVEYHESLIEAQPVVKRCLKHCRRCVSANRMRKARGEPVECQILKYEGASSNRPQWTFHQDENGDII